MLERHELVEKQFSFSNRTQQQFTKFSILFYYFNRLNFRASICIYLSVLRQGLVAQVGSELLM